LPWTYYDAEGSRHGVACFHTTHSHDSVRPKKTSGCAKCGPETCQWKFFVLTSRANMSATRTFRERAISSTASAGKSVRVSEGRRRLLEEGHCLRDQALAVYTGSAGSIF
jgi:hypothetical protein